MDIEDHPADLQGTGYEHCHDDQAETHQQEAGVEKKPGGDSRSEETAGGASRRANCVDGEGDYFRPATTS
jgi:hypothetical protein